MCQFFSCISDGKGNILYFDEEQRKKIRREKLKFKDDKLVRYPDSHTSIAKFYGINAKEEDKWNKWECILGDSYPRCDTLNTKNDYTLVFKKLKTLDMKKLWNASFKVYTNHNSFKKGETVLIKSLPFKTVGVTKEMKNLCGTIGKIIELDVTTVTLKTKTGEWWFRKSNIRRIKEK